MTLAAIAYATTAPTLASDPGSPAPIEGDAYLRLDGRSVLRVDLHERPGHFTLEAWVRGAAPTGRHGLISNAEGGGFAIFWSDAGDGEALPGAYVHAGGAYARAGADQPWDFARWTHLAMTYDGASVRFFVDGEIVQRTDAPGPIHHNGLPLYIGADVNADGRAVSFWKGDIDQVRLSRVVRYRGEFAPDRSYGTDDDTVLMLAFDQSGQAALEDASKPALNVQPVGKPEVVRYTLD